MSDFTFQCPFCKQPMDAPASMMGQLIDCPGCGKPIEVAKKIPDWKRPPGRMPASIPAKTQSNAPTRRKSAAGSAAQWAGGLVLGYILFAPVSPELATGYSERLAIRLVGGVALLPILFFSIWGWKAFTGRRK